MPTPPSASVPPSPTVRAAASLPATVDGLPVMTISEAIAQRDAGTLGDHPVAISGFWSGQMVMHSCAAPNGRTGELENYCHDGEFGLTELDEHIEVVDQHGFVTVGTGPKLTPFVGNDLAGADALFNLPYVNGQLFPPVPIVVVGHFDDPRAADCRPVTRQLCKERLVLDRIVSFDPGSLPTPAPTPTPTPFPFADPPPAPYAVADCVGDNPTSFVGWKSLRELGIDLSLPDEVQFIVIARDPIPIGDWFDDPNDGSRYRLWGQRVRYGSQFEPGAIGFTALPATEFREYPDGHHEPTVGP